MLFNTVLFALLASTFAAPIPQADKTNNQVPAIQSQGQKVDFLTFVNEKKDYCKQSTPDDPQCSTATWTNEALSRSYDEYTVYSMVEHY